MSSMQNNYIQEAAVTNSRQWNAKNLDLDTFIDALCKIIIAANTVDSHKKLLFYGKNKETFKSSGVPCTQLPNLISNDRELAEDLIHGILGIITEAGELAECLYDAIIQGKEIDLVNIREEMGDSFWYHAIMAKAMHITFDEIEVSNIAKLRARYPEKFTSEAAINRNLELERKVLEGSSVGTK
jgi:NTP pyrophosphatase (non-canonical NTP hydrolase)